MKWTGMEKISEYWNRITQSEAVEKLKPMLEKMKPVLAKTGAVLALTGKWAYQLRSVLLAIPVAVCAGTLAIRNARQLPEIVGMNILTSEEYQWLVSREFAVLVPVALTAVCLILMFFSKKVLYPWLISVFSLALPLLIWAVSTFVV